MCCRWRRSTTLSLAGGSWTRVLEVRGVRLFIPLAMLTTMTTRTETIEIMLERQETVFGHLTRLAVWIQERVPIVEELLEDAEWRRDGARRRVGALWTETEA